MAAVLGLGRCLSAANVSIVGKVYRGALSLKCHVGTSIARQPSLLTISAYQRIHQRQYSEVISTKVEVNGNLLNYDRAGNGENVILLLPGALGSSMTDFKPQLEGINRDKFTMIAWDPPGYGKSIPPERTWPLDFFRRDADAAAALMKVIGFEKYSLMGWSDGGITALIMACNYHDSVRKLVVWGGNAFITDEDIEMYERVRDISSWSDRMREPFIKLYGEEYFKLQWSSWIDAISRYYKERKGDICIDEVEHITCDTLIVHGQKDAMVGQNHADFLHNAIATSRLVNLPDGKHNLHFKYAKEFNKMVEEFLLEE